MKKTIYIFIRTDLSASQKTVQSAHVVLEATRTFHLVDNRYNIVVVVAKSEAKLKAIVAEAAGHGIRTVSFAEPDMGNEITAVASEPLDDDQKKVFIRYKLLS